MRGSVEARAEGGSIDLSKGSGPRALSQLTATAASARQYPSRNPRSRSDRSRVLISSCYRKKTKHNGHLRPIQARRALQDRPWQEQVRWDAGACIFVLGKVKG